MTVRPSPRAILVAALAVFAIYAFPGYIGWDTEAHLLQARSGIYTDAHPPIIAALWRVVELLITGPVGMLAIQAATLLAGLYSIFRVQLAPRVAAIAAAAVFVFPPVAGVTALVIKDALMAGFLVLGAGWLAHGRTRRGLVACAIASAMRWNALAATLPIIVGLLPTRARGVRRLAIAVGAWLAITIAAMGVNALLTDRHVHYWYGTQAYQDIGGTLRWMDDLPDADANAMLAGVPLASTDRIQARTRAAYNPSDYRQLTAGPDRIFDAPKSPVDRTAIAAAWWRVVVGHPAAYARYRWDNFRYLIQLDHPYTFAHVYVWFTVIAAPEETPKLQHDAAPSRIQDVMRRGSIALSNTWLYWPWIYMLASCALLVMCRRQRVVVALLVSGLAYQLAWFVLAPTSDFRYSQWMVTCCAIGAASWIARRYSNDTTRPSAQREASHATIA